MKSLIDMALNLNIGQVTHITVLDNLAQEPTINMERNHTKAPDNPIMDVLTLLNNNVNSHTTTKDHLALDRLNNTGHRPIMIPRNLRPEDLIVMKHHHIMTPE
ncbi:uncharacterized protein LY89DRAFT_741863 [Mollisia scopiformis]|uniref:Uncharacterized protein n=1 Tax=Mollisia scopiformis TaxID=149040 RepID=A0A132B8C8_MOLSC|nr:uncharacterized protein LY89DRAFT_741863 [Mollisia scopiformis]KUJ08503.1 hypothetical protein LY89DRAFT_741863 [Mollisia scopiformis]